MRLREVNGGIKKVKRVVAAVEQRTSFNGVKRRILEECKDSSVKPNALVFVFEENTQLISPCFDNGAARLLVGNLTTEKAEKIMDSLLKTGYADISKLKYQKRDFILENYKVDDGESGAYAYEANDFSIFTNVNSGFGCIFQPAQIPDDEEGGFADEFEEGC